VKWFRYWSEALDDEKVHCVASYHQGEIESLEQVAFRLRLTRRKAQEVVGELVSRGLLDPAEEGWSPHNWAGRQFASDDVAARVRKHRLGVPCNVSGPLPGTPPDTDTENR
jgi:diadenosine tetraphosphatase ApaH/serine/threonine PP2A family protein phosphatase